VVLVVAVGWIQLQFEYDDVSALHQIGVGWAKPRFLMMVVTLNAIAHINPTLIILTQKSNFVIS